MKQANSIGIILSLVLAIVASKEVDKTREVKTIGRDVVQTTVNEIKRTCIFSDDRLFVRRMAYVETEDGKDRSTFRSGFFGGIWQVTKSNYDATKACNGNLQTFCSEIKRHFNIDWQKTSWKDLLKPFYSALAVYLSLARHNAPSPGNPVEQEKIWRNIFPREMSNQHRTFIGAADALSLRCDSTADLVFLLDESGSVGKDNFDKMKIFLENVTSHLTIGEDNIRMSLVKFGSDSTIVTYLNQDQTNEEVIKSIKGLTYNSGMTATDKGINTVTTEVFNKKNGGQESGRAQVLVVITDGHSNSRFETVKAADNAKSKDINIFSVGVTNGIDYNELHQVASNCSGVFTMESFDEFHYFINELTKETCKAKARVGQNFTKKYPISNNGSKANVEVKPSSDNNSNTTDGQTIVVETNCAFVKIYGSYDNENPSESMFQISATASDGRPIVLFVKADKNGRPLFLSLEATKVNTTEKVCLNDSNFAVSIIAGKAKAGKVICSENGALRNCTTFDLIESKWGDKICPRSSEKATIANPCTPDRLKAMEFYFPYPNDKTKFLKCDLKGRVYVITCPEGLFYEPGRDSCGNDSSWPETKKTCIVNNPCTPENIQQGRMYFPYPNNRHYFIQCDQWGVAWVVPCPDKFAWNQKILQCLPENAGMQSPCTEEAIRNGNFYFPYPPDKHKFIHCSGVHHFIIQSCGNMVYNDIVHNCLLG